MSTADLAVKNHISYLMERDLLRGGSGSIVVASERTTFVYAPNATGVQPGNVFTVWADLLAAVALTRGPITIQPDPTPLGTLSIPGGDLSGHKDVWLKGVAAPTNFPMTIITVTAPFTNGYPNRFSDMELHYDNGAAPMINVPSRAIGGVPVFVFEGHGTIATNDDVAPLILLDGSGAAVEAYIFLHDNSVLFNTSGLGNGVFASVGVNAVCHLNFYDGSGNSADTLTQGTANTMQVTVCSRGATFTDQQAFSPGGLLHPTYSYPSAADQVFANLDGAAAAPANNTSGAGITNVDVMAASVIPRTSGRFRVSGTLQFQSVVTDLVKVTMFYKQFASGTTIGNATNVGSGGPTSSKCYVQTVSGGLTYAPGPTFFAAVNNQFFQEPAAGTVLTFNYSFSSIVMNGITPFPLNQQVVFTIALSDTVAATIRGPSAGPTLLGSISVVEMD